MASFPVKMAILQQNIRFQYKYIYISHFGEKLAQD